MQRSKRRPWRGAALAALALAMLAGCGGNDSAGTAFTAVKGSESAYCDTYRGWQVHELDLGDLSKPAALRAYWSEYLAYLETAVEQAPPELSDQQAVNFRAVRTLQTPILEKYDFDEERIGKEGTKAELAILEELPPDAQKAQAAIDAYGGQVCGTESPPAADVVFKANGSAKKFRAANGAFFGGFDKWASSGFDPAVLRRFVTADDFTAGLDALDATAPVEIAANVQVVTEWFRTRWSDVAGEFDYDLRRVLQDATPEDRAVFNRSHPEVVEHWSRATAYAEQVCT